MYRRLPVLILFVYSLVVPPGDVCLSFPLLGRPPGLDEGQYRLYIILPEVVKPWHSTKAWSRFPVKNPLPELRVGMVPSMSHFVLRMRSADAPLAVPVPMARPAGCGVHFGSPGKRLTQI